ATLRALFAPHARPLTARDQWSAPFHELATLPEARADLPDLSAHATPLPTPISAPRAPTATPPAPPPTPPAPPPPAPAPPPPPPATAAPRAATAAPAYYQSFLTLAGQVQQHLAAVGEPEVATPVTGPAVDRGTQITREFAAAADRHRESLGEGPP